MEAYTGAFQFLCLLPIVYPQENLEEIESTKPVVYNEGAIFHENMKKTDKIVRQKVA